MANIINYNSWDTNFKTPFGALKTCESAIIKVESSKAFDVCSIKLIIEKEDENLNPVLVRVLELQQSGENEKVREYSVEISPLEQPATYYYFLSVEVNLYGEQKTLFYGKQANNGMICEYNYDDLNKYQLTVYEDYKVPSWFKEGPEEYQSWWGIKALPNTNELEPSFMDYIIYDKDSVINKWMNMGVKGWRLDVADELPTKFIQELKKEVKKNNEESIVIGEVWEDASNKISYGERRTYLLGDQLDSVLGYPFRDNLVDFLNGEKTSWQLNDFFMTIKENYPSEAFKSNLNLLSSHDIVRIKTALKSDKDLLKLAILTQMSFEGVPYIYYGDEAGLEGGKDPENRKTYPWKNEDMEIMDFYRHCSQFRNRNKVFALGDTYFIYTENDDVFGYIRYNEDDSELILINRSESKQNVKINLEADCIEEVTVTYSVINNGEKIIGIDNKFNIDIDSKSYRIFKLWK